MNWLLFPPIAFVAYLFLVWLLERGGHILAGPSSPNHAKSATYGSGEAPPQQLAAPGYRPFFIVALFFAVLHLGMLIVATGGLTPITGFYVGGLLLALIALILG